MSAEHDDTASIASSAAAGSKHEIQLPESARLILQVGGGDDASVQVQDPSKGGSSGGGGMGGNGGASPTFTSQQVEGRRDPAGYVRDVRTAFSGVPRVRPSWQDRYMKMLVVGEAGLGKSTFVQNLFAAYAQDPNLRVAGVPGPTSKQVFASNPEQLCTTIDVTDDANQTRFHYAVQDTPGWDSMDDNMEPILEHISKCHLKCLENEQDARRLGPMHKAPDSRVDLCIYFISPHRIKEADVKFMAQLSEAVPVIPILAKADCMTAEELSRFRGDVRDALVAAKRQYGRDVMYEFSKEALKEAFPVHEVPPFAVISSRTMDTSVGRYWPVRRYPWGTCEALASEHSDVAALKKLLLEISFEEFKNKTEERYYAFREEELLNLNENDHGRKIRPRFILNREKQRKLPVKALRWVAGVVITYGVGAFLLGGRSRIEADAHAAREKASEAAGTLAEVASDAKQYIEEKVNPPPAPRKKVLGIF